MDLAILILVNLGIAIIMYFLFSLRFSVALEKAEKASRKNVVKELKQNIEQTIRLMDDSLDIIDQKMTTFYRLVRRAEELAEIIEAKPASRPKKTLKKQDAVKETVAKKKDPGLFEGTSEELQETGDDYMDRLLGNVKGEKIEISGQGKNVESIYRDGKLTGDRSRFNETDKAENRGAVEKLGGFVKKIFGADNAAFRELEKKSLDAPSLEAESNLPGKTPDFSEILEQSRKKEIELSAKENAASAVNRTRKDLYVESVLSAGELLERYYEEHANPVRSDLVRYLLRHGFIPSEISRELGMSPAEVELIASLPASAESVRKTRIQNVKKVEDDA